MPCSELRTHSQAQDQRGSRQRRSQRCCLCGGAGYSHLQGRLRAASESSTTLLPAPGSQRHTIIIIQPAILAERELSNSGGRDALLLVQYLPSLDCKYSRKRLTVPVVWSQTRPPLQPPSRQDVGPETVLKSQSRRPYEQAELFVTDAVCDPRLTTHPDACRNPCVRDAEGHSCVRILCPARETKASISPRLPFLPSGSSSSPSHLIWDDGVLVGVCEHLFDSASASQKFTALRKVCTNSGPALVVRIRLFQMQLRSKRTRQ